MKMMQRRFVQRKEKESQIKGSILKSEPIVVDSVWQNMLP